MIIFVRYLKAHTHTHTLDWKGNLHRNGIWFQNHFGFTEHESLRFQGCDVVTAFNSWQRQTVHWALGNTKHIFLYLGAIVLFFIVADISKAISLKVPSSPIKCCPYPDRLGVSLFKMSATLPITLVHMWGLWDLQVYEKLRRWKTDVTWQTAQGSIQTR